MAKVIFALGFGIGLTILGIAVTAGPQASGIAAPDIHARASAQPTGCTIREVSLDEGYGISRKAMKRICAIAE